MLDELTLYLGRAGVQSIILVNQDSIYKGYKKAFDSIESLEDKDICILCHDDIKVFNDPREFLPILIEQLGKVDTGFVGVAGTTHLSPNATWWDQTLWRKGKHSGLVFHVQGDVMESTFYGNYRQTVCLDGLFLAATVKTIRAVGLEKPNHFPGEWDFYDIHYTVSAHKKGLKNYTVPIFIKHQSRGELVGRDSWHKNREAFIKNTSLPIVLG